jgi:O-antigen/teichoic acid export membrane protein
MGSNFLMLPIIIYYLDADMLGLWYVFASIGAIAVLFDFGFGVTFARNITYCWSGAEKLQKEDVIYADKNEPDYLLMRKVLMACKTIYLRISSSALFLMLTAGMAYVAYVSSHVEGLEHLIAWGIYSIAVFLNLYYGYYGSFLRGVGAIGEVNKNTVIARAVQILLTIVLLMSGMGIIGVCVAYLAYGTLFRILGKWKFYHHQHLGDHLNEIKQEISKDDIKQLVNVVWHNAWRDGVIALANYLSNQATVFICSLFLTLSETGVYSIGVQIAMAIAAISGTFYIASQPQLQSAYVTHDVEKTRSTMSLIVVSLVVLFAIGVIAFVFLFLPLLRIVKPEAVVSVPVLLGLCAYHLILQFRNCYTSYFSCSNRIPYMPSFILSAILCIVLSLVFTGCLNYGVWGLIGAQIISQLAYNVWHWPLLAHREMNISALELAKMGTDRVSAQIKKALRCMCL